jgi:uncharacterized membrane protein
MRITYRALIIVVLFAVSAFMFVGKLLMPTPIQIIIPGEEPIVVGQIFRYTHFDVVIISISAIVLAVSSFYLLFGNSGSTQLVSTIGEITHSPELDVKFVLRLLDGDKRKVFSEIVEADGEILQSDLHVQTRFSRAKITRILDYLELKGLIVRKSYGMTNKIVINRKGHMETKKEQ